MYFEEKGEGFPLVLLHGNGEDHHYFDRQIDFFSRYYRVLAPDTPGHGLSPKGEGDFTLERFSRDPAYTLGRTKNFRVPSARFF